MADLTLTVTYFAILLGFGIIVASIMKRYSMPDTFFLLLVGVVMGPTLYLNPFVMQYVSINLVDVSVMGNIPDFLRILALIMVVFTSTFSLGFKAFKKFSHVSINVAIIGVAFNTVVLGLLAHLIFGINPVYALLLGAVISGTGTGVLFAFEDSLKKMKNAFNILKIESILNSPLSVLLPLLFIDLVYLEPGALIEPMKYLSQFWIMIIGGIGTGIIVGLGISKIIKRMKGNYTVLMLFAMALITYALAENVGGSGMLAVAICGLIVGDMAFPGKKAVQRFDDQFSEMLRISVFTLLGAQVMLFLTLEEFLMIFVFYLLVFLTRPLILIPLLGKMRDEIGRRDFLLMSFVAPRGLSAAAMAPIVALAILSVGEPEAVASQVINIIFMVILLSVLFSTIAGKLLGRGMKEEEPVKDRQEKIEEAVEKETEKKKVKSKEEILEEVEESK
jgi:cell volume regulation protein A